MQKNKFPKDFLKNFKGIFKKVITIKIPNEKNACSAEELKFIAAKQKYNVEKAINYKEALNKLTSNKSKGYLFYRQSLFCRICIKRKLNIFI